MAYKVPAHIDTVAAHGDPPANETYRLNQVTFCALISQGAGHFNGLPYAAAFPVKGRHEYQR